MKCPFTSLLPNLDIICFISMMMLTIKRKQKNDRIVRHDFICLLNAEVFSALSVNKFHEKKQSLSKCSLVHFYVREKIMLMFIVQLFIVLQSALNCQRSWNERCFYLKWFFLRVALLKGYNVPIVGWGKIDLYDVMILETVSKV